MVEQFKFSINVKPRLSEEYLYTGVVDIARWIVAWCQDAYVAYLREMGIFPGKQFPPNMVNPQLKVFSVDFIMDKLQLFRNLLKKSRMKYFKEKSQF